jgi:hypothetical protein
MPSIDEGSISNASLVFNLEQFLGIVLRVAMLFDVCVPVLLDTLSVFSHSLYNKYTQQNSDHLFELRRYRASSQIVYNNQRIHLLIVQESVASAVPSRAPYNRRREESIDGGAVFRMLQKNVVDSLHQCTP